MLFIVLLFVVVAAQGGDYAIDTPLSLLESLPQEIFDLVVYDICKPKVVLDNKITNMILPDMASVRALCLTSKTVSENSKKCIKNSLPLRLLQGAYAHEYCTKFFEQSFKKTFKTLFSVESNTFQKIRKEYDGYYQEKSEKQSTNITEYLDTNSIGYRCNAANKFYANYYQNNSDVERKYTLIQLADDFTVDIQAVTDNPALMFDYMNHDKSLHYLYKLFNSKKNNHITTNWINWLVDVNKADDDDGRTPLLMAVWDKNFAMAQLLITHNADVNKGDNDGTVPLYRAVWSNNSDIMQLLINHSADVNKADNHGQTPLYWAVGSHSLTIAQLLITHNADVNKADNNGFTPLFFAVYNNILDMAQLLIDHKADVKTPDNHGRTPLFWAKEDNNSAMMKLLNQ